MTRSLRACYVALAALRVLDVRGESARKARSFACSRSWGLTLDRHPPALRPLPAGGFLRFVRRNPLLLIGLFSVVYFAYRILTLLHVERGITGGEISLPLDDSFIYLQYARALASGHPFVYTPGNAPTTGATSLLWPFLLAPTHLLRLGPDAAIAWSLALGAACLLASALLMARIGRLLAGTPGMLLAAGLFLGSPHLLWGYMSGMEIGLYATVLLAALLLYAREREEARFRLLHGTLFVLAASRPEGAILSGVFGLAMAYDRWRAVRRGSIPRFFSPALLLPFAAAAFPFLVNLAISGSFESTSSQAKSILAETHPDVRSQYIATTPRVWISIVKTYLSWLQLAPGAIMATRYWIPTASALLLFIVFSFLPRRRPWVDGRIVLLLFPAAVVVGSLPVAWSVHFYRYQQGFYPVVLACIAAGIARTVTLAWTRLPRAIGAPVAVLAVAAPLWAWAPIANELYTDVTQLYGMNCENILHQQVKTGRWIAKTLPPNAVVAMNDAGAIAYYGNRSTVDLVGLTSAGYAKVYRSGVGCLFEELRRAPPGRLPTDFAIYEEWFPSLQSSGVLGPEVFRAHLEVNTICGADDKVVFPATWSRIGPSDSLALDHPETAGMTPRDTFDSGWIDGERSHEWKAYGYEYDDKRSAWRERPSVLLRDILRRHEYAARPGRPVSDNGRKVFGWERFRLPLTPGRDAVLIVRTDAWYANNLAVTVDGAPAGVWTIARSETAWVEPSFRIPGKTIVKAHPTIELRRENPKDGGDYTPFHYWVYQ